MGPGREVDESPPCSAEVEYERRYASTPPVCLHGLDGGKIDLLPLPCAFACRPVRDDPRWVNQRLCDYHLSLPALLLRISSLSDRGTPFCAKRKWRKHDAQFSTNLCVIGSSLQRRPFISVPFYTRKSASDCVVPNLSRLLRCSL